MSINRLCIAGAAILVLSAAACSESPEDVLRGIEQAAQEQDMEAFASRFTEDSQPYARALLGLYRSQAPLGTSGTRPLELLAKSRVLEERTDGDRAELVVESSGRRQTLIFARESGTWRFDVEQTDRANADRVE
jgi:hypothetical protein